MVSKTSNGDGHEHGVGCRGDAGVLACPSAGGPPVLDGQHLVSLLIDTIEAAGCMSAEPARGLVPRTHQNVAGTAIA